MKATVILGVLLILLGIALLSHEWITYTSSTYPDVFQSAEGVAE